MAAGVFERCLVIGVVGVMFLVQEVWGQGSPPAVVERVAFVGDPAPGIPNATCGYLCRPQMDGAGNVYVCVFLEGPDVSAANNMAFLYGPPGGLQKLLREGEQAPDMPAGVVISNLYYAQECVGELGWIVFVGELAGPGIETGVNHVALFAGPPGDLRKVIQGGDAAPGFGEGIYVQADSPLRLGALMSDNGTLFVGGKLTGGELENAQVWWTGTRENLQVLYHRGMAAPGCDEGVKFLWADGVGFNDSGEVSFRGGLTGPGVTGANDVGHWFGGPGVLTKIARRGDQVPEMAAGVTWKTAGNGVDLINADGVLAECSLMQGPGVTEYNDKVFFLGGVEGLHLVGREGDPAPEAGAGVDFESFSGGRANNRGEVFYQVKYAGPGITDENKWALYFGPVGAGRQTLRDGAPAPTFPPGVVLKHFSPGLAAMNDAGDVVGSTQIAGPGVTAENNVVLWLRHRVLGRWVPLLRSGDELDGRMVYAEDEYDFAIGYFSQTGGADGRRQSLNDEGALAMRVEFTDGTHGIYLISPPVFGDRDGDGDADEEDWALLLDCWTGPAGSVTPECVVFDLDLDGDVDLIDQQMFQQLCQG